MESLTIHAVSRESAEGFCAGLSEFEPKLIEREHGRCDVEIALHESDRVVVAILNALQAYVTERSADPARIEVYGHSYTMRAPNRPRRGEREVVR